MKRLKNNETIEVLGASFKGVKDMIEHIDRRGKLLVKFRTIRQYDELDEMYKEAKMRM